MAQPAAATATAGHPILVVDDEPALRNVLRMILELEGHQVLTAADGVEAVTAVKTSHPAVLLLDLHLPRMDGWQAYAQIRSLAPALPVIFMSAKAHVEREAQAHQAAGALPKPFDVDQVLDTVARFVPNPAP